MHGMPEEVRGSNNDSVLSGAVVSLERSKEGDVASDSRERRAGRSFGRRGGPYSIDMLSIKKHNLLSYLAERRAVYGTWFALPLAPSDHKTVLFLGIALGVQVLPPVLVQVQAVNVNAVHLLEGANIPVVRQHLCRQPWFSLFPLQAVASRKELAAHQPLSKNAMKVQAWED